MTRERLPERRQGVVEILTYKVSGNHPVEFASTYNWEEGGRIKEVFTLAFKEGSDMQTLLHHACITASIALQRGETMADMARALGEDDPGKEPSSILGLIVRAGAVIDEQRGFTRENGETTA